VAFVHVRSSNICRALVGPWKSLKVLDFFQIFKAWKVLENRHGPWKSLNLCLKVLESAWICFSKTLWPNQLILKKVFHIASFWPQMCIKSIFSRGFAPDPSGLAYDAYICLQKCRFGVKFSSSYISFVWSLKVLEKSLNLILTNGQEPWLFVTWYGDNKHWLEIPNHTTNIGWKYPIIQAYSTVITVTAWLGCSVVRYLDTYCQYFRDDTSVAKVTIYCGIS